MNDRLFNKEKNNNTQRICSKELDEMLCVDMCASRMCQ